MQPDQEILAGIEVRHRRFELGEVALHGVVAGEGPLVVLLHGFPEFWFSWRHQIPALVRAGWRVVAVDQRGYATSDKPASIAAYRVDRLADDVAQLIDACGAERAVVVGHDWGGVVAWVFAMRHPQRLDRLVVLNAPHPVSMGRSLLTTDQLRRSWYIFFFQLPGVPERRLRRDRYHAVRQTLRREPIRRGAFSEAEIERYVEALDQPGALTGAINYYRAVRHVGPRLLRHILQPVAAPVLLIWGERDRHLTLASGTPGPRWAPNCRIERLADASHWVQVDRPQAVNTALASFLSQI